MDEVKTFGHRYPWDVWLAQTLAVLRRGVDFDCEPYSMGQLAARAVRARRLRRTIRIVGDSVEIGPKDPRYANRGRRRKQAQERSA